jgi:ring-1,2-phenylacetyl-CoA epoxidase subunit PaaC
LDDLWKYSAELFYQDDVDEDLIENGIIPAVDAIKGEWDVLVRNVLEQATLIIPSNNWEQVGGRKGIHSEHLGYILAELQYMQRAYPGMKW